MGGIPLMGILNEGGALSVIQNMVLFQIAHLWVQYSAGTQKRADSCPTGPPQRHGLVSSIQKQRSANLTSSERRGLTSRALDTVDLRNTYGTTVKNQGQSGACATFTTTTLVEVRWLYPSHDIIF